VNDGVNRFKQLRPHVVAADYRLTARARMRRSNREVDADASVLLPTGADDPSVVRCPDASAAAS
jgi:hypothetical protein